MISAQYVKQLREATGAGIAECKKALEASDGNFDEAVKIMQKNGSKIAAKKAGREAAEGVIGSYIHTNGKMGVMVEVNCETDFVSKSEEFKEFAHEVAMHIMAMDPEFVSVEEIDPAVVEKKRVEIAEDAKDEKKPADIMEKIIAGRVKKNFEEIALLTQPFVKDPSMTVGDLLTAKIAKFGENVKINRFVKMEIK